MRANLAWHAWLRALTAVAIEQIKSATLLVYNLYKALSSSDAASQKIVLRIIGFLAIKVRNLELDSHHANSGPDRDRHRISTPSCGC